MLNTMPADDLSDLRDAWRVFRIISEFVDGFETMTELGPSVSIFGSARLTEASPYYDLASQIGKRIAEKGFAVITGGGPGMMEAANRGAQLGKGKSCGLSVTLPMEWEPNKYLDQRYNMTFRYFFIRKVMFVRYAQGYVFLPGGVGTFDELFEALTLIQTEKTHPFPIYLVGKAYWAGLVDWMRETVLAENCIDQSDLDRMIITDDPDEIAEGVEKHYRTYHAAKNF